MGEFHKYCPLTFCQETPYLGLFSEPEGCGDVEGTELSFPRTPFPEPFSAPWSPPTGGEKEHNFDRNPREPVFVRARSIVWWCRRWLKRYSCPNNTEIQRKWQFLWSSLLPWKYQEITRKSISICIINYISSSQSIQNIWYSCCFITTFETLTRSLTVNKAQSPFQL